MPSSRTLAASLLPPGHGFQLRDVSIGPDQITATLATAVARGTCPVCGTWSEAVHSRYQRTIADLPWGRQAVRLHLHVRKFFCRQPTCTRQIFTERLPQMVAARYTRGSLLVTSNVSFDGWGALFGDNVIASAILDRLLHQSEIFAINGPSYRLKDKLAAPLDRNPID